MARRLLLLLLWVLIPAASFADLPPEQPDEPLFQQSSIAPEDFVGVFDRVKLSEPSTEKEFFWLMDALDSASSAEEAAGLLPASVYQQQPDVVALIETGILPPTLPPTQNLTTTGESIPSTPAAGGTLLPGYPGPYGFHMSNPTNNWGMPNSPSGGCGPWFIRGDGLYFDFRRACYQHDLAYRWTPVDRLSVDLRLLREMLYDCSLRSPLTIRLCAIRAGLYFTFVSLLGGPSYGATLTPGYNATGTPMVWPAPYSSCAQASHVWVYTDGYGNRVPRNKSLYFTGVVRQYSRVRYQLIDAYGNVALQHMTHAAQTNCVIHHEQERVSASVLPNGIYQVRALFTPWETEQVTVQDLGSLEIFTPTGSTTCNQNSHAWVYGAQYPVTVGAVIYPTGVVRRNTPIYFSFVSQTGGPGYQHTTHASQNNCVVNHEPEARSTAGWTPGRYDIYATYTEWETDQVVTKPVGVLDLRSSGGGGGGGGGCLSLRDQCE